MALIMLLYNRRPDVIEQLKGILENDAVAEAVKPFSYFFADYQTLLGHINNKDNISNLEVQKDLYKDACQFCATFITKH